MVAHYVHEHDVPEVDVAAALAVVLQGDEPLLLDPEPERPARPPRGERPDRAGDRSGDRGPPRWRATAARWRRTASPWASGTRSSRARSSGAIANEGGLRRQDFGAITIRPDFSLVELPAELSAETWDALRSTRISGKLIGLKKDDGPPGRGPRSAGKPPTSDRKPRHKKR